MPIALVTGGNRGLGLETSRQLAARGYDVILTARDETEGRTAAASLPGRVRYLPLDLDSQESVDELGRRLEREPPVDALVNNAGTAFSGFDAEVARRTIETNFRGTKRVTERLWARLGPGARVVMVSSGTGTLDHVSPELAARFSSEALDRAGLEALVDDFVGRVREGRPLDGWPRHAYSVSKIALNAYTRLLAREVGERGLMVNAVCPGWVRTRMGRPEATRSVEQGAGGIVWAATLPPGGPNGGFFRDGKPIEW